MLLPATESRRLRAVLAVDGLLVCCGACGKATTLNAGADPLATPVADEICCPDAAPRLPRVVLDEMCSSDDVVGSERSTSNENALETGVFVERGVTLDAGCGGGRSERAR